MTNPEPPTREWLTASRLRARADALGLRPTKARGQNFVVDANTIRRIVRLADVAPQDVVVEVGPGLGSLTLGLLDAAAAVTAIEIDPMLADALPETVAAYRPESAHRLTVVTGDALALARLPDPQPTALVANLPYNVSVPVVLNFLERFARGGHVHRTTRCRVGNLQRARNCGSARSSSKTSRRMCFWMCGRRCSASKTPKSTWSRSASACSMRRRG